MEEERLTKAQLWDVLELWDEFMPGPVRLVACGGTALTIQDLKASTRDVDFVVPDDDECRRLIGSIRRRGYEKDRGFGWKHPSSPFIFDIFPGKKVFTTELLDSPLEPGMHIPIRSFRKLEVGALNDLDLVISKMFRGEPVDVEDSLTLIHGRKGAFDVEALRARYEETASDDVNPERMMGNLERLLKELKRA